MIWTLPLTRLALITCFILLFCSLTIARLSRIQTLRRRDEAKSKISHQRLFRLKTRSEKPNIILILTDDQDVLLGSLDYMPKTRKLMTNNGAFFNNSFVSTPMCCPSRSTLLTGMYSHNHNVFTNNENCSSTQWQQNYETRSFATYLSDQGYRTGYFGKYLNEYNGSYIPPGWREWMGLIRNSRFYNYSVNFNGKKMKHGDNYYEDYFTDLIANDSVTFLKQSKQLFQNKPVLMVLSVPAPHGTEDAAPQYQHLFANATSHRTPSWNYAPNKDKQWLLQHMQKMEPIHQLFTDRLQMKRLQTLQSVDDLVEKVGAELKTLGELDDTYILYTSDHGYHLGQFGLIKGKAMPYDFDVRVPLIIRGPGIKPGITINNLVANIDIAPTILDMAGIPIPSDMDGRSLLPLLKAAKNISKRGFISRNKPWRDTVLLERGKISKKIRKQMLRQEKMLAWFSKSELQKNGIRSPAANFQMFSGADLVDLCERPEFKSPCKPRQAWECRFEKGVPEIFRCRTNRPNYMPGLQNDPACICPSPRPRSQEKFERLNNRNFIRSYINKETNKQRYLRSKLKRSLRRVSSYYSNVYPPDFPTEDSLQIDLPYQQKQQMCRVFPNNIIVCDPVLYEEIDMWKNHKDHLDTLIQEYQLTIKNLKDIRKHLKKQKPSETVTPPVPVDRVFYPSTGSYDRIGGGACDCSKTQTGISMVNRKFTTPKFNTLFSTDQPTLPPWKRPRYRKKLFKRKFKRKFKRNRKDNKHECRVPNMKCFTHDNDHWKTPPYWNFPSKFKTRHRIRSTEYLSQLHGISCKKDGMECSIMDNDHWKTPPFWTYGPFCFCSNSNNNTYWCIRTVNETHNFLYCEFITGFISYYNMLEDPYQLKNSIHEINYGVLQQLHANLEKLRKCKGAKECSYDYLAESLKKSRQENIVSESLVGRKGVPPKFTTFTPYPFSKQDGLVSNVISVDKKLPLEQG